MISMEDFSIPSQYRFREPPWLDSYYSDDQKRIYRGLRERMLDAYDKPGSVKPLRIEVGGNAFPYVNRIFIDVMEDNPMLFKWEMELKQVDENTYEAVLMPIDSQGVLQCYENQILRKIAEVREVYGITPAMSEIDIIRCVNKWLLKKKYSKYPGPFCHRALGIMLKGEGVCASFAASNHILLNSFGVECYTVSGMVDPKAEGSIVTDWDDFIKSSCKSIESDDEKTSLTIMKVEPDIIVRKKRRKLSPNPNHAWNVVGVDGYLFQSDPTFNNGRGNAEYLVRTIKGLKDRKSEKWGKFAGREEIPLSPYFRR